MFYVQRFLQCSSAFICFLGKQKVIKERKGKVCHEKQQASFHAEENHAKEDHEQEDSLLAGIVSSYRAVLLCRSNTSSKDPGLFHSSHRIYRLCHHYTFGHFYPLTADEHEVI